MPWAGIIPAAGALAQTAGNIMDLFGGNSGGFNANDYGDQIAEHWKTTMSMAKKYGIHPLVAMGVNPSSGGYANVGDSAGRKLARIGQNLRRMSPGSSPVEKAQVEHLRALTELTRKRTALLGQDTGGDEDADVGSFDHTTGVVRDPKDRARYIKARVKEVVPQAIPGVEVGKEGFYKQTVLDDGGIVLRPTSENMELTTEGIYAIEHGVMYARQRLNGILHDPLWRKDPVAIAGRNQLRKFKRYLDGQRKGKDHRFNVWKGAWYAFPMSKTGKRRLYVHDAFRHFDEKWEIPWRNMKLKKSHSYKDYSQRPLIGITPRGKPWRE